MKKFLLTFVAALGLAATANAQLPEGSVFPDFTLYDINGNVHNLYTDLNSGKTVFIDISATWCPPCWAYHNTHALDSLYAKHGPTGLAGVYPSTTNDVVVLFVQGEATSHLAELYGDYSAGAIPFTTTELPYAQVTQGNWVAGTLYPIIDDTTSSSATDGTAALDAAWHIAYFPTVYMICRDHLVHVMTQPTADEAYAATLGTCPTYAPSATVDVKATAYTGNDYFICNATPSVSFQNYSTNTLTSATITVKDATGAVVTTQPWTGSLAPYAVTSAALTSFPGTSFGGYKYSVTATGDTHTANDISADSVFKVYDPSNAQSLPWGENFEGSGSYKYDFSDPNGLAIVSNSLTNPANTSTSISIIGTSGSATNALWFDTYDATHGDGLSNYTIPFLFGNYAITHATLSFDESYAPKSGSAVSDSLQVMVSSDCGASWHDAWSAGGTTLGSAPALTSNWFVPSAATQWKHVVVSLNAYASTDLMIQFQGRSATTSNGELIYVDNINLTNTTAVPTVTLNNEVNIYPNPAKDDATVELTLNNDATVSVEVYDAVGRLMITNTQDLNAGTSRIALSTAQLASGLYHVKITAGESVTTKQLSVIK